MTLVEVLALLDATPAIVDIHPVSLSYLPSDVSIFENTSEVVQLLDSPEITLPGRFLIKAEDRQFYGRFPHVVCQHDPFTNELNAVLFERYNEVANRMLCQGQLAAYITKEAKDCNLIVLLLIDGLSYQDVKNWSLFSDNAQAELSPCLVDVPSVTRIAFPHIINSPTIAERLFDLGYHNRLGFTYWTREDNPLTNQLFFAFSELEKTNHFPHILTHLDNYSQKGQKTFVQIIRTGLDGYAHSQKRIPPIGAIVSEIEREFMQIANLCARISQKYGWHINIHLTADHGILWLHECEPLVVGTAPSNSSARWCQWRDLYYQEEKGRQFLIGNEEYYCLGYPKLRRPPRIDEQGVHGGISYQESIVPFITVRIR